MNANLKLWGFKLKPKKNNNELWVEVEYIWPKSQMLHQYYKNITKLLQFCYKNGIIKMYKWV